MGMPRSRESAASATGPPWPPLAMPSLYAWLIRPSSIFLPEASYIGTYQSRGLERHHHDRVGEVGPVVARTAVPVEGDVDPLVAGDLVALDVGAALAADKAADHRGHVGVEEVGEPVQGAIAEDADHQPHRQHRGNHDPRGGQPIRSVSIARASQARPR